MAKKEVEKTAKKVVAKKEVVIKAAAKKETAEKPKRKINSALAKPLQPDEVLAGIIGKTPVSRGEIIKKLWDYIKANKLQDESNKRMINADEKLGKFFDGKKQISMFDLAKLVGKHIS